MARFLVSLVVSIIVTVLLWNFGLALHFWPAHPLLATTVGATICGMLAYYMLPPRQKQSGVRK